MGDEAGGLHLQLHEVEGVVVVDDGLDRQLMLGESEQLAQEHREAAVTGQRDDLPVRLRGLHPDRLGQRVRHRSVGERAQQPALPVHREVAGRPHDGRSHIGEEDRVVRGRLVDEAREVLRVDAATGRGRELVQLLPRLPVVLDHAVQVLRVRLLRQQRQQRLDGGADVAHEGVLDADAATDLPAAHVHLDDGRVLREELRVGEVRAQQDECLRAHHRVIAGGEAQQAGHPHVVGVVVLDELLAAQRVDDGGLETLCQFDDLVMRALDPGTGQDRHLRAVVEGLRRAGQSGPRRDE